MKFPVVRHRRLRRTAALRSMVRETQLDTLDLIAPIFVTEGHDVKEEIASMPGVYHLSLDRLEDEIREITELGLGAVLLFGVPDSKDAVGSTAYAEDGIVQRATRAIKAQAPDLLVVADTCLCQFTDHGHCGVVHQDPGGGGAVIDNDESLALLAKTAVSQARAGADIIAPSNMMDGFVHALRQGLDEAGYTHIPIMSYAVKYASAFYGPFRDAAHSTPQFGDRRTYQMDPGNLREALREARADAEEGADMLMVKPAMAYLDVLRTLREHFELPLVAYNVSAEYAMIKAGASNGWLDEEAVAMELLLGMKRAGADLIITYFAKDAARWMRRRC
ncbi:porphobilinogen synthase [Paenibacillus sp. IB182496]|uniref:Delta-aminolevulinic acid dehydratase n=1 Tax=Paenibacillus sabuli TaxID=2772509 RepID=A0A927BSC5_9BACL|nr:porphobilinogen synthase [Paenibacillus sabuli]MBD2844629.1 porphobilinogen synthase [Paenibacillus sabuli]